MSEAVKDKLWKLAPTVLPTAIVVVWVLVQTFARADGDARWVPQRSYERDQLRIEQRLDRMETKIDRLIERGGGNATRP